MKSKRKMLVIGTILAILIFGMGLAVGAATAQPGSTGDPVITKSYLDSRVSEFQQQSGYQAKTLARGKKLTCESGAQIVITSGNVKATAAMVDLTTGKTLAKNKKATKNHTYLITANNGGVKASSNSKVFVIGTYE